MSTSFQQNRPIVVDSELPAQTAATNGKALISNGMTASWQTILGMIGTNAGQVTSTHFLNAVLPSQIGNVGKVLQTDGSNSTWVMEPTGFTGSRGSQGFTGSAGTNGTTGAVGFTGSAGTNGTNGTPGAQGYTGSAGSVSLTGVGSIQATRIPAGGTASPPVTGSWVAIATQLDTNGTSEWTTIWQRTA